MVWRKNITLLVLAASFSLLLIGGCPDLGSRYSSTSARDKSEIPTTSEPSDAPDVQFADIPVPRSFSLVRDRSYSHEEQSYRVGYLFYEGRGRADEISNFYKENMPLNSWGFVSKDGLADRVTMKYVKEEEVCLITIDQPGKKKTTIFIQVHRRHAGSEKKIEMEKAAVPTK